jgi:hypothetical protein
MGSLNWGKTHTHNPPGIASKRPPEGHFFSSRIVANYPSGRIELLGTGSDHPVGRQAGLPDIHGEGNPHDKQFSDHWWALD